MTAVPPQGPVSPGAAPQSSFLSDEFPPLPAPSTYTLRKREHHTSSNGSVSKIKSATESYVPSNVHTLPLSDSAAATAASAAAAAAKGGATDVLSFTNASSAGQTVGVVADPSFQIAPAPAADSLAFHSIATGTLMPCLPAASANSLSSDVGGGSAGAFVSAPSFTTATSKPPAAVLGAGMLQETRACEVQRAQMHYHYQGPRLQVVADIYRAKVFTLNHKTETQELTASNQMV